MNFDSSRIENDKTPFFTFFYKNTLKFSRWYDVARETHNRSAVNLRQAELRLPNAGGKGLARAANKKPQRLAEDCLSGRYR
jgi:hypothetical protein